MDITDTILSNSNQLNADDLIGGPLTITVTGTRTGTAEQPLEIYYTPQRGGEGRPYKPSKSMRRCLAHLWGLEADAWVGRRMRLYRDAGVVYGGVAVGGIRISHMSDIDEERSIMLTARRGKKERHVVAPLPREEARAAGGLDATLAQARGKEADLSALREAAARGTEALREVWAPLSRAQKAALKGHLEHFWKPTAQAADAACAQQQQPELEEGDLPL